MTDTATPLAVRCRFLVREIGRAVDDAAACCHPVREGKQCVGPFLEDLGTSCGLWEAHPQSHLIPLPQPERWQQRRRREGFDFSLYTRQGYGRQ